MFWQFPCWCAFELQSYNLVGFFCHKSCHSICVSMFKFIFKTTVCHINLVPLEKTPPAILFLSFCTYFLTDWCRFATSKPFFNLFQIFHQYLECLWQHYLFLAFGFHVEQNWQNKSSQSKGGIKILTWLFFSPVILLPCILSYSAVDFLS